MNTHPSLKKLPNGDFRLWTKASKRTMSSWFDSYTYEDFQWALKLVPGDYVATCEGCNRKVVEVIPHWTRGSGCGLHWRRINNYWIINDVQVVDTNGRWHWASGPGCLSPKERVEDIVKYNTESLTETLRHYDETGIIWDEKSVPRLRRQMEHIQSGGLIVDEFGEYLEDFKLL